MNASNVGNMTHGGMGLPSQMEGFSPSYFQGAIALVMPQGLLSVPYHISPETLASALSLERTWVKTFSTIHPRGKRVINLRSDTCSLQPEGMKQAMYNANVGDAEYFEDSDTIRLENMVAQITGKEAALLFSSGVQANQVATIVHTGQFNSALLSKSTHIHTTEVGGLASFLGVKFLPVETSGESLSATDIENEYRTPTLYNRPINLVILEQPLMNGRIVPLNDLEAAYKMAKSLGQKVHIDAARLFNATAALDVDVKEITQYADSLMFCLSKGLGAPIGSMLCGSKELIDKARQIRKLLGGGMRQTGYLAACGIWTLENMVDQIAVDNINAKYLGQSLDYVLQPHIEIDLSHVETNMVFFKITKQNFNHDCFIEYLRSTHIIISPRNIDTGFYRLVTHHGVTRYDVDMVGRWRVMSSGIALFVGINDYLQLHLCILKT
ncbi:MAG: threonine aldolase family protein [Defluviitaleaceae bacterium]|nr:threonine aldolase family protein [Defluviitaleaceae bacterium]